MKICISHQISDLQGYQMNRESLLYEEFLQSAFALALEHDEVLKSTGNASQLSEGLETLGNQCFLVRFLKSP